jgi:hypothetical protein
MSDLLNRPRKLRPVAPKCWRVIADIGASRASALPAKGGRRLSDPAAQQGQPLARSNRRPSPIHGYDAPQGQDLLNFGAPRSLENSQGETPREFKSRSLRQPV